MKYPGRTCRGYPYHRESISSGGGALLEGLSDRLSEMLNLQVAVGENPQDDVAVGACMAASNERLMQKIEQSGCLTEV